MLWSVIGSGILNSAGTGMVISFQELFSLSPLLEQIIKPLIDVIEDLASHDNIDFIR